MILQQFSELGQALSWARTPGPPETAARPKCMAAKERESRAEII